MHNVINLEIERIYSRACPVCSLVVSQESMQRLGYPLPCSCGEATTDQYEPYEVQFVVGNYEEQK